MSIRIAFIVSAPLEMTLTAGRHELTSRPEVPPDKDTPFLHVGHHLGDEIHMSGPLIGDPEAVGFGLQIDWYFPNEESAEQARPVDISQAQIFMTTTPRQKAEPGWQWRYCLESRKPYRAVYFFEGGFQPPFKDSNISLKLDHIINYNYDGYILSRLTWEGRSATQVDGEWVFPRVESEGVLVD